MAQDEHSTRPVEVTSPSASHFRQSWLSRDEHLRRLLHHEMMERMMERMWGGRMTPLYRLEDEPARRSETSFVFSAPALDLTEDDKAFTITAEVPGLEQKDIEVSLSGDVLTLRGKKRGESEQKEKGIYISERAYGSFQRSFALPSAVQRDKISAGLSDGVLTITLPKSAEGMKSEKKIEVKAAA